MIKTIIKHHFLDKLLNSLFDNLINTFKPAKQCKFNLGDHFNMINIQQNFGMFNSKHEITRCSNCTIISSPDEYNCIAFDTYRTHNEFIYETFDDASYAFTIHGLKYNEYALLRNEIHANFNNTRQVIIVNLDNITYIS